MHETHPSYFVGCDFGFGGISGYRILADQSPQQQPPTSTRSDPTSGTSLLTTTTLPPAYLMKSYEAGIRVYEIGKEAPVKEVEFPLSVLPPRDKADLTNGIRLESWKEVLALLEDFTG